MSQTFSSRLCTWYNANARDLPWRRTRDPYKIWISEIMLQQTTVNTVIPYYDRWIKTFPHLCDVARARLPKILKCWQGLGYYQRARNILHSARIMCRDHSGKIPNDPVILQNLPGFGPYTRAAVLSIAFNRRVPLIDTNVRRVCLRQQGAAEIPGPGQDGRLTEFLESLLPRRNISTFNQALMELGALVCRPRDPDCHRCPVKISCRACRRDIVGNIPWQRKRSPSEKINATAAVIEQNGKFFIQKRAAKGLMAGLWEFPGGKVEKGETDLDALNREIKEELDAHIITARPFMRIRHTYTRFKVDLKVWMCRVKPDPVSDRHHQWVTLKRLSAYPMPSANARILDRLKKESTHLGKSRKKEERCYEHFADQ